MSKSLDTGSSEQEGTEDTASQWYKADRIKFYRKEKTPLSVTA